MNTGILGYTRGAGMAFIAALLLLGSCAAYYNSSSSMLPEYGMFDVIDVVKCRPDDLRRNDVVMYRNPATGRDYFHRLVALPGDEFRIENGAVVLNGDPSADRHGIGRTMYPDNAARLNGTVPPGKCIVLGDNREFSYDGRYWGYLPLTDVVGRAGKVNAPIKSFLLRTRYILLAGKKEKDWNDRARAFVESERRRKTR